MRTAEELKTELNALKVRVATLEADIKAKEQHDLNTKTVAALRELANDLMLGQAYIDSTKMEYDRQFSYLQISVRGQHKSAVVKIQPNYTG
jgi:hypothetical protein